MKNTIPHYLKLNSEKFPNEIAMREKKFGMWRTKTWLQCYEEVQEISLGLDAKGIKGKRNIAILGNNTPRWVLPEVAIQSLGGTVLGLYPDALENEIFYLLNFSICKVVFVEDEEQADKIMSLPQSKDMVELIVYDETKGMNKYSDQRLVSYKELTELGRSIKKNNKNIFNEFLENINEDNICVLCPTSGTTANPKLAMISHSFSPLRGRLLTRYSAVRR